MSEYRPTIGLEIHAELQTQTKMFCSCANDADQKTPNVNICPICMAHPGALPVINQDAVYKVLLVGAALDATLADFTEFDRKNYFYPDIPKGYQISQYAYPLVTGGKLQGVDITRIHLEEDTARSQHEGASSFVDYNRAGVPLMELVTEPTIHDADTATSFAREFQVLLRYIGVSEANMDKGEMRVEANISVSKTDVLGTKVEVKNLNSFRTVERAIKYEIDRQVTALEAGELVSQETRGWDEKSQSTYSQRKKESSEDYRYFPEPDLPKLKLSEVPGLQKEILKKVLPILPWEKRDKYLSMGLKVDDADMFVRDIALGHFFDQACTYLVDATAYILVANYISSDIAGKREAKELSGTWLNEINAARFAALVSLIQNGLLSSRGAKDTLALMYTSTEEPETIAIANGLIQKSDTDFLIKIVLQVLESHPTVVAEYKAGKDAALQFLVGQGMKESKGAANPEALRTQLKQSMQ